MNRKTIQKVLSEKVTDWIGSIEDGDVRAVARKSVIVTGGSIASMLLNEDVNDYDIYFTDRESCAIVAQYYIDLANSRAGLDIYINEKSNDRVEVFVPSDGIAKVYWGDEPDKYLPVHFSSNAITLSGDIQLVTRFSGDVQTIHENYDFVHCSCSFEYASELVVLPAEALEAILTKTLIYRGSKYPLSSVIRTRKFIQRGWFINAGQYLKMLFQLNEMDLKDIDILREQLIGVDLSYFDALIRELSNYDELTIDVLIDAVDHVF